MQIPMPMNPQPQMQLQLQMHQPMPIPIHPQYIPYSHTQQYTPTITATAAASASAAPPPPPPPPPFTQQQAVYYVQYPPCTHLPYQTVSGPLTRATTTITAHPTPVSPRTAKTKGAPHGRREFEYVTWENKRSSKSWTASEDALLRHLKEVEHKNWFQIAAHFPERTTYGCQRRIAGKIKKGKAAEEGEGEGVGKGEVAGEVDVAGEVKTESGSDGQ